VIRSLGRLVALVAPAAVILVAAAATPISEFFVNQGDVGLYLDRARAFASGQVPYRDFFFEYPPLALLPMTVPYLIWPGGSIELPQYRWLFAGWEAGLMVVLGFALTRIRRLGGRFDRDPGDAGAISIGIRLTALSIGAALALTWRFDLFPALLVALAVWATIAGRATLAGFALALGVLAKLYPIAVLPALAARWLVPFDGHRVLRLALAVAGTVLVGLLPFVALAGASAFDFLGYQVGRGLQIESIGGGIAILTGLLSGRVLELSYGYSAVQVEGQPADLILAILPLLTVIGFGVLAWLGWRRVRSEAGAGDRVRASTVVSLAGASMLVLLVTSKVYSIQYVVWLLPFAALLPRRQFLLALAIVSLTMPIHPLLYADLVRQIALPIIVLNTRNALLVALACWVLWDLAKGNPRDMSRQAARGWRARRDSNPRPSGPQPDALSAELRAHTMPARNATG
jgi:Glycosyltransferase family 87